MLVPVVPEEIYPHDYIRHIVSLRARKNSYRETPSPKKFIEAGAEAEWGICQLYGFEWGATFKQPRGMTFTPAGRQVIVRKITYPGGRLVIYPKDPDEAVVFLVGPNSDNINEVKGWVFAEKRKAGEIDATRGYVLLAQDLLYPPDDEGFRCL